MECSNLVLDIYGNNAAVRCPACSKVFVVSGLLNKKMGRQCPECAASTATFIGNVVEVKLAAHSNQPEH